MFYLFKNKNPRYITLEGDDLESDSEIEKTLKRPTSVVALGLRSFLAFFVLLFASILISSVAVYHGLSKTIKETAAAASSIHPASPVQAQWICQQPAVRKEWRTLSDGDKSNYIAAVKCLADKPSKLRNNGSLYDDYPWVHKSISSQAHKSAMFLPWHRYYIHLYEKQLTEDCGLTSPIPYWDWSLDWEAPAAAPVWDSASGFGGSGSPSAAESVGDGRCVDGPFGDIPMMFYDGDYQPHCLSRGFPDESELAELGKLIHPSAVEDMMRESDYKSFEMDLEHRAHNFLSRSVRGDLSRFTGPNDPIFYLHHTNIDRIWWQWQQQRAADGLSAYNGKAYGDAVADDGASLADAMDLAGLAAPLPVSSVMSTVGSLLCYTY